MPAAAPTLARSPTSVRPAGAMISLPPAVAVASARARQLLAAFDPAAFLADVGSSCAQWATLDPAFARQTMLGWFNGQGAGLRASDVVTGGNPSTYQLGAPAQFPYFNAPGGTRTVRNGLNVVSVLDTALQQVHAYCTGQYNRSHIGAGVFAATRPTLPAGQAFATLGGGAADLLAQAAVPYGSYPFGIPSVLGPYVAPVLGGGYSGWPPPGSISPFGPAPLAGWPSPFFPQPLVSQFWGVAPPLALPGLLPYGNPAVVAAARALAPGRWTPAGQLQVGSVGADLLGQCINADGNVIDMNGAVIGPQNTYYANAALCSGTVGGLVGSGNGTGTPGSTIGTGSDSLGLGSLGLNFGSSATPNTSTTGLTPAQVQQQSQFNAGLGLLGGVVGAAGTDIAAAIAAGSAQQIAQLTQSTNLAIAQLARQPQTSTTQSQLQQLQALNGVLQQRALGQPLPSYLMPVASLIPGISNGGLLLGTLVVAGIGTAIYALSRPAAPAPRSSGRARNNPRHHGRRGARYGASRDGRSHHARRRAA